MFLSIFTGFLSSLAATTIGLVIVGVVGGGIALAFYRGLFPKADLSKVIMIALAALAILAIVFAGYRHFENTQNRLVQAATQAAADTVKIAVAQKSHELEIERAKVSAASVAALSAQDAADDAEWDAQSDLDEALPTIASDSNVPASTPAPEDKNAKPDLKDPPKDPEAAVAAAIAALNRNSDAVDGMLERASRGPAHKSNR